MTGVEKPFLGESVSALFPLRVASRAGAGAKLSPLLARSAHAVLNAVRAEQASRARHALTPEIVSSCGQQMTEGFHDDALHSVVVLRFVRAGELERLERCPAPRAPDARRRLALAALALTQLHRVRFLSASGERDAVRFSRRLLQQCSSALQPVQFALMPVRERGGRRIGNKLCPRHPAQRSRLLAVRDADRAADSAPRRWVCMRAARRQCVPVLSCGALLVGFGAVGAVRCAEDAESRSARVVLCRAAAMLAGRNLLLHDRVGAHLCHRHAVHWCVRCSPRCALPRAPHTAAALASKDLARSLPRLHPLAPPLRVWWCWQRALSLWLSDGVLPLAPPLARANCSLLNGQRPPRTVRTSSPWKRNCRTSEAVLRARAPRARQLPRARTQQRWQN